jgi:hypothetical protein
MIKSPERKSISGSCFLRAPGVGRTGRSDRAGASFSGAGRQPVMTASTVATTTVAARIHLNLTALSPCSKSF